MRSQHFSSSVVKRIGATSEPRSALIWPCGSWHGTGWFLLFAVWCWIVFMIVLCRYTVAAVALEQLSFADCVRHKAIVMEVATTEAREGGNPMLGVFYDAEARAFWADEAAKLGDLVSISSKLEASRFLVWVFCSCHCGWLAGAERHDFASCTIGSERS
jgi:hypothetical protein